jgi:hypothetical protein
MDELYATTFSLASVGEDSAFDVATERLGTWAWERIGEAPDLQRTDPVTITRGDRELGWWRVVDATDGSAAITMTLAHPDRLDETIRWRTHLTASHSGAFTRVTVRLAREAMTHLLRPGSFAMRPPAIIAQLLDTPLRGYAGAIELRAVATRLTSSSAGDYVIDVLQHDGRVLPVVVVADESALRLPAGELARRLVGLAHVAVLTDSAAFDAFAAALPEGMFVPPGGARIYWPGFGSPGDRTHHRYWTRSWLRERRLDAELRRLLSRLSVARVPVDPVPLRIQQSMARAAVARLRREVDEAVKAGSEGSAHLEDLQGRYDKLELEALEVLERNDELQEKLKKSEAERESLTARLATTEENLSAALSWRGEEPADSDEIDEDAEPPDNWSQFAERVNELISPGFQLTERAFRCAEENSYPRPARMWESLERLSRAADAYNARGGAVGDRLADWATQFELDIALTDSSYTNTKFDFEGHELDRLPHVKIDDAVAPNEVGRIYFAIDSPRARFVVDWFGVKRERP